MHIQDVDKFVASSEQICLPIWMGDVRISIQIAGKNNDDKTMLKNKNTMMHK